MNVTEIYLVGSQEDHFIVDRVYATEADAIAYCDSRANWKYVWKVKKAGFGDDWIGWATVHVTPRHSTTVVIA